VISADENQDHHNQNYLGLIIAFNLRIVNKEMRWKRRRYLGKSADNLGCVVDLVRF